MSRRIEGKRKAELQRSSLRLSGVRTDGIIKPATDRENFIIQAMARGRTKVELISVWDTDLGDPPSVLEVDSVVQRYWEYYSALQKEYKARRTGIPDASAVLDALTNEILKAEKNNNSALVAVFWGHYIKVYTTERRLKEIRTSEFRRIARLIWKSICERMPNESLAERRKQLQGALEMLSIPIDVDEVLLDGGDESD